MASSNDKATPGDVAEPPKSDAVEEPKNNVAKPTESDTVEAPKGDQRSENHSSDSRISEDHLPEDHRSDVGMKSISDSNADAIDGHKSIEGHKPIAGHPAGPMPKFPSRFYARQKHIKINRKVHEQYLLCPSFKRDDLELFNIIHERMKYAEWLRGSFRFYITDRPYYSDPVLAKVDGISRVGRLRSKGGNTFSTTLPAFGSFSETEIKLGSAMSTLTNGVRNLNFKMDIDGRTETFEWRQTRGKEVKLTHRVHEGWKLVRTSSFRPEMGGKRRQRVYGFSSDGAEILAILSKKKYAENKESKEEKLTRVTRKEKKEAKEPRIKHGRYMFSFIGNGLTGTLGQRWETMAVISGHILWLAHLYEPSKALLAAEVVVVFAAGAAIL